MCNVALPSDHRQFFPSLLHLSEVPANWLSSFFFISILRKLPVTYVCFYHDLSLLHAVCITLNVSFYRLAPLNKLVSLTELKWALRSFWRFTLRCITVTFAVNWGLFAEAPGGASSKSSYRKLKRRTRPTSRRSRANVMHKYYNKLIHVLHWPLGVAFILCTFLLCCGSCYC